MPGLRGRSTTWNFVFFLDSVHLSSDWRDEMETLHVPLAYIVHDRDDAKPHVHVLVRYDSLKSLDQVRTDFAFTGVEYFEVTRSYRGMCRYLIHLDPLSGKEQYTEKYQYSRSEIVELSGIALDFSRKITRDEERRALSEITDFINDNDIREFSVIWNYVSRHYEKYPVWFDLLSGRAAYSVNQFIRSRAFSS
ncbi:MAG: Rep family protein [Tractidigestivibacter sp.]|uniref:Rep family protein n=1 Tax=Tractidigestivibacter sp. TaxID=2847320 RepID=UPI002A8182C7|nr:Rep family protein [Tractidigestivibacter sp.]MCI6273848.1 replication protein [Coriobacteriaceae bacterium]MDY4535313.1 Rep family protein [Tractidigestivibacter sp.]